MIRIVQIYRMVLPIEKDRVRQVQDILRQNFPAVVGYADKIPDLLERPVQHGYTAVLFVSETSLAQVTGFCLFLYFPHIRAALLDFLGVRKAIHGGGTGGALYEAVREYLKQRGCRGLYMEASPDDPKVIKDPAYLKENQRRLRFYERYGVRPIIGTAYETPLGDSPAPHLLFDSLDRAEPLSRGECRAVMRTILKKRYGHVVSPQYVEKVARSVVDDPVHIRPPKYIRKPAVTIEAAKDHLERSFVLVSTTAHEIHHVAERGYVERPARVRAIKSALEPTALFDSIDARHFREEHILAVHSGNFVRYLKAVCQKLESTRPVYPYVFPIRRPERPPKELAVRAGYYCIDTFTPLDRNAFTAAKAAVDVALTAAEEVLKGRLVAYALCRPPGHHAEPKVFGGFCYFNNAAIAAQFLSRSGRVATLDIDFHHGNGTQYIFYNRPDVLTLSIHGHPNTAYPYFSGFADEAGDGQARGRNFNFPLQENCGAGIYLATLEKALAHIRKFAPTFLVVSLGFDTMRNDPTGSFGLTPHALRETGKAIAALDLPMLVVQEGGYSLSNLKSGSVAFFMGIADKLGRIHQMSNNHRKRKNETDRGSGI
jgi:acetoin utilization deacetylase AcuC-like enzyme/GNAT superfamily N-acetyltransferase